jgi:two-component system nitrogen regulation response regulator GlnG
LLKTHDWPGNVRELENFLKRIAALSPSPIITARDVERELAAGRTAAGGEEAEDFEQTMKRRLQRLFAAAAPDLPPSGLHDRVLAEVERPLIQLALKATKGNQIRAAAMLGINRNTLRKKIQLLGVRIGEGD